MKLQKSTKMWFKLIYIIFLFSASVLSLQRYGMLFTPRQIMTVVMFFVCLVEDKKFWSARFFSAYLVFILFFGLSSTVTGYPLEFLKRLIGDYFVAYVALWSTKIVVVNKNSPNTILWTLLLIGAFDGLLTLFQFLGITYLDSFVNRFQLISFEGYMSYQGQMVLDRCMPGVFSHPVLNAHVLMACTILSLSDVCKRGVVKYIFVLFMLVCLFATQQRSAFILALSIVFLYVYREIFKSKHKVILYSLVTIFLLYGGYWLYEFVINGEFRFTELGLDNNGRDLIYAKAGDFVLSNPFGGYFDFVNTYELYPHNLFYNAFIFGGWLGGGILLYIIYIQVKESIKSVRGGETPTNEFVLALCVLAMIANGVTHNQSIVNAEIVTWIIWGAFYYTKKQNAVSNNQPIKSY